MNRFWILGMAVIVAATVYNAQPASAADPPGPQHALEIEILLVEHHVDAESKDRIDLNQPADKITARVRELETSGKITSVDRIRLTTLENQRAMVQTGQQAPVVSGVMSAARGGPPRSTFQNVSIGTVMSAMAKVDSDSIVIALDIEKSQLEPPPVPADDETFQPRGILTLTSQVTVSVKDGETVLVTSKETDGSGKLTQQVVLATAQVLSRPANKEGNSDRQVQVFPLKYIKAEQAAVLVKEFTAESAGLSIAVDMRSNALVLRGDADDMTLVSRLLEALDHATPGDEAVR